MNLLMFQPLAQCRIHQSVLCAGDLPAKASLITLPPQNERRHPREPWPVARQLLFNQSRNVFSVHNVT